MATYTFAPAFSGLDRSLVGIRHELIIRQQPDRARVCTLKERERRPVDPPPIVQFKVHDVNDASESLFMHSSRLFMCAMLLPAQPGDAADAPGQAAMAGNMASSLQLYKDIDGGESGFFIFGDLSVRVEGSYRLRFSLFELVSGTAVYVSSVLSDVFTVYTVRTFPGMAKSTLLSRLLSDQGARLRIRKESRTSLKRARLAAHRYGADDTVVIPRRLSGDAGDFGGPRYSSISSKRHSISSDGSSSIGGRAAADPASGVGSAEATPAAAPEAPPSSFIPARRPSEPTPTTSQLSSSAPDSLDAMRDEPARDRAAGPPGGWRLFSTADGPSGPESRSTGLGYFQYPFRSSVPYAVPAAPAVGCEARSPLSPSSMGIDSRRNSSIYTQHHAPGAHYHAHHHAQPLHGPAPLHMDAATTEPFDPAAGSMFRVDDVPLHPLYDAGKLPPYHPRQGFSRSSLAESVSSISTSGLSASTPGTERGGPTAWRLLPPYDLPQHAAARAEDAYVRGGQVSPPRTMPYQPGYSAMLASQMGHHWPLGHTGARHAAVRQWHSFSTESRTPGLASVGEGGPGAGQAQAFDNAQDSLTLHSLVRRSISAIPSSGATAQPSEPAPERVADLASAVPARLEHLRLPPLSQLAFSPEGGSPEHVGEREEEGCV